MHLADLEEQSGYYAVCVRLRRGKVVKKVRIAVRNVSAGFPIKLQLADLEEQSGYYAVCVCLRMRKRL